MSQEMYIMWVIGLSFIGMSICLIVTKGWYGASLVAVVVAIHIPIILDMKKRSER